MWLQALLNWYFLVAVVLCKSNGQFCVLVSIHLEFKLSYVNNLLMMIFSEVEGDVSCTLSDIKSGIHNPQRKIRLVIFQVKVIMNRGLSIGTSQKNPLLSSFLACWENFGRGGKEGTR